MKQDKSNTRKKEKHKVYVAQQSKRSLKGTSTRITPGLEIKQSWANLVFEIIRAHPDWPSWEIKDELRKRGLKVLIPGIGNTIKNVRASLGVDTWRFDRKGSSCVAVPVRMSREQYEAITQGGKNAGLILEDFLKKSSFALDYNNDTPYTDGN